MKESVSAVTSGAIRTVHDGEEKVVTVPTGEERPFLRRPYSFCDEKDPDDPEA